MKRITIDCANREWKSFLKHSLQEGLGVDLINFDYTTDGQLCEMLALAHDSNFSLDAANSSGFFRKKSD